MSDPSDQADWQRRSQDVELQKLVGRIDLLTEKFDNQKQNMDQGFVALTEKLGDNADRMLERMDVIKREGAQQNMALSHSIDKIGGWQDKQGDIRVDFEQFKGEINTKVDGVNGRITWASRFAIGALITGAIGAAFSIIVYVATH